MLLKIDVNVKLILISSVIFLFSSVLGFSVDIPDKFKGLEEFSSLNIGYIDTNSLIVNNLKGMLIIVLGSFSLGLFTVLSIVWQGYILGLTLKSKGLVSLLLIIPHGVFEFPSIWFAGAAGLKGPQIFHRYLKGGNFVIKEDIKEYLTLTGISIILIIIAGVIEAKFTLKIVELVR